VSGRQNKSPHPNAPPRSPLRSHLAWHGRQWRVQVAVPAKLRPIIGTAVLFYPLHTDSLALANRDKHKHIQSLKDRLRAAEVELRRRSNAPDPLVTEALEWKAVLAEDPCPATEEHPWGNMDAALDARVEELIRSEGEDRAELLATIATGRATPIGPLADKWIAEKPIKPRQRLDYRRAVSNLEAWLAANSLPQTLEAVTKTVAADYRADAFIKGGVHPRTANKSLSVLSGLCHSLDKLALPPGPVYACRKAASERRECNWSRC
jgi:hypothetical protein